MTKHSGKKYLVAYIPVLNQAYLDMLTTYNDSTIGVLDTDVLADYDYLRKDIRALNPKNIVQIINKSGLANAELIPKDKLTSFCMSGHPFVMPEDDISRSLLETYPEANIELYPVFLRWHRDNIKQNVDIDADRTITGDSSDPVINALLAEAQLSSDWWRRVGACVVENDTIIMIGHNQHMPSSYTPHIDNDMRMTLGRGDGIELITVEHAEAGVLAQCARAGIATSGLDMYVTTFPCPACAKFIASAGIKRLYYLEGYAMGDGRKVLKDSDVELIHIDIAFDETIGPEARPYPEKD